MNVTSHAESPMKCMLQENNCTYGQRARKQSLKPAHIKAPQTAAQPIQLITVKTLKHDDESYFAAM